jgi:DNA-binding transcriptional LysR family regulator
MPLRTENPLPRLSRLHAFEQVAATGAMSAAANLLHVTQPAVTHAVRALEKEVGARLLERRRGGSFLTREGQIFARRTGRFFHQLNAALAEVSGGEAVARLARNISTVHIRSLLAISKGRSFREAARILGIAEPTLHRSARDLERLFKVPVYRRTIEGIGLSPAGAELARRLSLAATEIRAGIEELASHHAAATTRMTVGVLTLAPRRRLALVAEQLLRAHPKSRLIVQEGAYDELAVAMRSGAIDVIFGALRAPPPFPDLHEEVLFDDPYCVVCRRGHPLTRQARVTRGELRSYDWVFPTSALPRRRVLDEVITAWRLSKSVQIETNSISTIVAALAASDRLSLLPREYAMVQGRSDRLAVLDIRVPHRPRSVGLTTRADWLPTAFQADLLALLRQADFC